jgi:hypothetical protein
MTERDQAAIDALIAQMVLTECSSSELQARMCAKCGEDVTYWLSPCAEPGCPAVKQDG